MLPIRKYELGINGEPEEGGAVGVGLQDVFPDEDLLRIELLPSVMRTVQKTGIQNENFRYYADVLRRWINIKDPETGKSMYFVVKYDPRDLSIIYFLDPELKRYFPIPYRTLRNPKISLWEKNDAKRGLKILGVTHPDEQQIFESHMRGRAIVQKAEADTRAARRKRSAKRHDEETVKETGPKLGREETTAKQKAGKETQGAGPPPPPRIPRTDIEFIVD
jgi:putative transposase